MRKLLSWGLFILLFFLPILSFQNILIFPFETSKYLFLIFSVGILCVFFFFHLLGFKDKESKIIYSPLIIPIFLILIAKFVSLVFSLDKEASLIGLFYFSSDGFVHLLSLVGLYFLVLQVVKEKEVRERLVLYTFSGILLSALAGLYQYFMMTSWRQTMIYRIRSTVGEPNRLSFTLEVGLWLGIILLMLVEKKWKKWVATAILIIFICWFLTFTRTAQISLGLTVLFVVLIRVKNSLSSILKYKVLLLVVGIIFLIFTPFLVRQWRETIFPPIELAETSPYLRFQEWKEAVASIGKRNILRQFIGFGPEAYSSVVNSPSSPYYFLSYNPVENIKIRNFWLHILTTEGFLSFFAWIILIVATYKLIRKSKSLFSFYLAIALLGILIHSLFYYLPLTVSAYLWFILAFISYDTKKTVSFKFISWQKWAFLVLGMFLIYIGIGNLLLTLIASPKIQNIPISTKLIIAPYSSQFWRDYSQELLGIAVANKDDKGKVKEYLDQSFKALNNAFFWKSYDTKSYSFATHLYYWAGVNLNKKYHDKALSYGKLLPILEPQNPLSFDKNGLIYLDLGQLDKAWEYFQEAIATDPSYVGAYLHSGEVLKQQGKIDEAIEYYKKALEIQPGWDFAENELEKALKLKSLQNTHLTK